MAIALTLFFASHIIPARPTVRAALQAHLGERAYLMAYSAVSVVLIGWLVVAAGRAPSVVLWHVSPWQLWLPNLVMPFVCLLLAFGVGAANPLSILGDAGKPFDPHRPGMARIIRHPVLWAVTLWAIAHAIPNGDLAHVLLFGLFAAFGCAGMVLVDARKRRVLGAAEWQRLARRTSLLPFAAFVRERRRPGLGEIDVVRLAVAIALYLAFLLAHAPVIGVSPFPPP
jgi:uncharacterized membrane protein